VFFGTERWRHATVKCFISLMSLRIFNYLVSNSLLRCLLLQHSPSLYPLITFSNWKFCTHGVIWAILFSWDLMLHFHFIHMFSSTGSKFIFPSFMRSLKVPNSNSFMTCAIDLQSTLCPFSSTQWILYFYACHALYIYQYHVGPLILDAYQTHTLSYIFSMPLWLCSELQGDLIFDAPSISTSYKYVKSSLFFKYWYTSSLLALKLFMCPLWVHHSWRYLLIILSRLKFYLDSKPSSICTLMPSLVFSNSVSKYMQCCCIIVPKLIKNHLLVLKCHTLISITPMITHL